MAELLSTPAAKGDWAAATGPDRRFDHPGLVESTAKQQKLFAGTVEAKSLLPDASVDHLAGLRSRLDAAGDLPRKSEAHSDRRRTEVRAWVGSTGRVAGTAVVPAAGSHIITLGRHASRPRPGGRRGSAMAKFAIILPAAGRSSRFKDKEKKPFATLDGRAGLATDGRTVRQPCRSSLNCLLVIAAGRPGKLSPALHRQHRIHEREHWFPAAGAMGIRR